MKKLSNILAAILFALPAESFAVVIDTEAGGLADKLATVSNTEATITLTGTVNAKDLASLSDFSQANAALKYIDLSQCAIASTRYSTGNYYGKTYLPAWELPEYIFANGGFAEIKLPSALTAIGAGAFANGKLESITLSEAVKSIGDYCFYGCSSLTKFVADTNLSAIGKGAFSGCRSLESADFESTQITSFPEQMFAGCSSLENLGIPATLESIGPEALSGTGISSLSLSQVQRLEPFALSGMPALKSVSLDSQAVQSEGLLSHNPQLESVSGLPANLPDSYLSGCDSYDAKQAVTSAQSIGAHALASTSGTQLVLNQGLSSVGKEAFAEMPALKLINATALEGSVPQADAGAFSGLDTKNIKLLVTPDSKSSWIQHPQWGEFNIITDTSTNNDLLLSNSGITITASGDKIIICAEDQSLEAAAVYSLEGFLLAKATAGADTAICFEIHDQTIVTVVAKGKRDVETAKILLK